MKTKKAFGKSPSLWYLAWIQFHQNWASLSHTHTHTFTHTHTHTHFSVYPLFRSVENKFVQFLSSLFLSFDAVRGGIVRKMSSRVLNVFLWKKIFFSNFTILWLHLVIKVFFRGGKKSIGLSNFLTVQACFEGNNWKVFWMFLRISTYVLFILLKPDAFNALFLLHPDVDLKNAFPNDSPVQVRSYLLVSN